MRMVGKFFFGVIVILLLVYIYNSSLGIRFRSKYLFKDYVTQNLDGISEIIIYDQRFYSTFSFNSLSSIDRIVREKHGIETNCNGFTNKAWFEGIQNNNIRLFWETAYNDYIHNQDSYKCFRYNEDLYKQDSSSTKHLTNSRKLEELGVNLKKRNAFIKIGIPVSY